MRKYLIALVSFLLLGSATVVFGAPVSNIFVNVLPAADQKYDLGSTSPAAQWKNIYTKNITVSGTCTGCGGGAGGAFPFSSDSNYGQVVYSTSTPTLWFKSGVFASSTSIFSAFNSTYGTTTFASSTALTATNLFGTNAQIYGSTTIGNGTQIGGLTISGGATTTKDLAVNGNINLLTGASIQVVAGAGALTVTGGTSGSVTLQNIVSVVSNTRIGLTNSVILGWTNGGTPTASIDTGITKLSPRVLAIGNGTGSDVSGTLIASSTGIGTSTPNGKFAIHLNAIDVAYNGNNAFIIASSTATATTTLFSVSNTGLLTGLDFSLRNGTSTSLAVTGSTTVSSVLNALGGANFGTLTATGVITSTATAANTLPFASSTSITSSGSAYFATVTGRVGIATTSPSTPLTIQADGAGNGFNVGGTNGNFLFQSGGVNGASLLSQSNSSTQGFLLGTAGGGTAAGQFLRIQTNGTERLTINDTGLVGVGSTTPFAKLSVKGAGTGTGVNFQTTDSNNLPLFSILDNGNVGIGTSTPFGKFAINLNTADVAYSGNNAFIIASSTASATTTLFSISNTGNVNILGSTTINTLNLSNALAVSSGGTGAATLTGCLTGNGTGAITGSGTCNTSAASVTSIATTWPIIGGTITTSGTLTFGGLGTSSAISAASGLLYATGVNTLASVSTSSAISMSITGNAGTVTTNANLSGAVTSSGSNVTAFGTLGQGILGNPALAATIPTAQATSTLYGTLGTSGMVLGVSNGIATWVATSTLGDGIGNWFPAAIYGTQAVNATSTGLWLKGNLSLIATSTFATFASSTNLTNSSNTWLTTMTSAILLTDSAGLVAEYAGASACSSNNFVTTISAVGGTTCGTAAISGINLGGTLGALTATNGSLTFSGSYDGSTARTVGINLANFNAWTTQQTFTSLFTTLASSTNATTTGYLAIPVGAAMAPSGAGQIAIDTTSGQFIYSDVNGSNRNLGNGYFYPAFTVSTSTAWTGTTTLPLGPAFIGETWDSVKCFTDTGTLGVSFYDGTNRMTPYIPTASTTVNSNFLNANNIFTADEKRYVDIGTPVSSPTKISCTVRKVYTAD